MINETNRSSSSLNDAGEAMEAASQARAKAQAALQDAEANLTRAASEYNNLIARAAEDEPIGTHELLAAQAAHNRSIAARDLAGAVHASASAKFEKAELIYLHAVAATLQSELARAVAARVDAARVAATKLAEAERALEWFRGTEQAVQSVLFACAGHDLEVQQTNNSLVQGAHQSVRPRSRAPQLRKWDRYRLVVVRDDDAGKQFLNSPHARSAIVHGSLGSIEANAWASMGVELPAPAEPAAA